MNHPEKKYKHLTVEDRIEIMECLYKSMSFKAIARRIGKDPSTVSKEVKLHAKTYESGFTKTKEICPLLLKAPFVCNGCEKQNHSNCIFPRRKYNARTAQQEYETVLKESREGIPLNKGEFYRNEKIISNAVKGGQHIYHAIVSNDLPVSKSTVYRHIRKGYYTISAIDLPRAVKLKQRVKRASEYVPKGIPRWPKLCRLLPFHGRTPLAELHGDGHIDRFHRRKGHYDLSVCQRRLHVRDPIGQ